MPKPLMTRRLDAPIVLLLGTALLAGCAAGPGGGAPPVSSFVQSDQVCAAQRQAMANAGDIFLQDAIIGGPAAPGAGAGALANAYLATLQQRYGGNNSGIVTQVSGDLTEENRHIQLTHAGFVDLMGCRRAEVQAVRDKYSTRQITRDAANLQLAAIRARLQEDYAYADKMVAGCTRRGKEFEDAYGTIDPAGAAYLNAPLPQPYTVAKPYPIHSAPSSKAAYLGSVTSGQTVLVVEASRAWWQIVLPDGQPGYVTAAAFAGAARPGGQAAPPPPPAPAGAAKPQLPQLATLTRTNRQGRQEFWNTVGQSKTQLAGVTQDLPAGGQLSSVRPGVAVVSTGVL
jgi:hypothetical protein